MTAHWPVKMTPGPATKGPGHCFNIPSFHYMDAMEKIILEMTNMGGFCKCGEGWRWWTRSTCMPPWGCWSWPVRTGPGVSLPPVFGTLKLDGPFFMPRCLWGTFNSFSRMIRFDNRELRLEQFIPDKLAPIRDVWEKWSERLRCLYNPGSEVTFAERLIPFRGKLQFQCLSCKVLFTVKYSALIHFVLLSTMTLIKTIHLYFCLSEGRCHFRQYLPRKPIRCGVEIWTVCDSQSSYAWNMQVYREKAASGASEKTRDRRVLLVMAKGLRGRYITCSRVFTSYELGQQLLKRKMTVVGEVIKNKPKLPTAVLSTKGRVVSSSKFAFTPTTALISYCLKRNRSVFHLNTLHKNADVRGHEDGKPAIIMDYNRNKGGVENLDTVTRIYSCKKVTARWPLAIFYNIINVAFHLRHLERDQPKLNG